MLSHSILAMAHGGLPLALYGLLAAALVSSQDTTSQSATVTSAASVAASSSAASSTSRTPVTHTVDVAKGGFTFVPDVIQAEVGDTVQFSFFPTNHSVVRAEYKYPCIPYELTGVDKVGFFSGFKPVDAILSDPPVFNLLINNSLPIFYYCSAPGSCINYAMVGVINPNSTVSLAVQKQDAKDSQYMLEPGQNFPDEGSNPLASSSGSLSSSSITSTSTTTSAAATSTSSGAAASASKSSGLSTGAIAGIAVGAAAIGLMVAALFFLWIRNKALHRKVKETDNAHQLPPAGPEASERGSYFYGAPPSHISGAYNTDKHNLNDRTSYVSSAYSPGLPQYAAPPPNPSPTQRNAVPNDGVRDDGMLSPRPTSPLVRPQSPPEPRTFTGFSTPPPPEAFEKPASGPHELATSISRATKRLSGRSSGRNSAQA